MVSCAFSKPGSSAVSTSQSPPEAASKCRRSTSCAMKRISRTRARSRSESAASLLQVLRQCVGQGWPSGEPHGCGLHFDLRDLRQSAGRYANTRMECTQRSSIWCHPGITRSNSSNSDLLTACNIVTPPDEWLALTQRLLSKPDVRIWIASTSPGRLQTPLRAIARSQLPAQCALSEAG